MLKRRLSKEFEVVSLADDALDALPEDAIEKYQLTRNLKDLPLENCTEKPTRFKCWPIKPEYEYLMGEVDMGSLWEIFRNHVCDISNMELEGNPWEYGTRRCLKSDARNQFSPDTVLEVAGVIIQSASRLDTRPFSMADTWRSERKKRMHLNAMNAVTEAASE